jgi:hypothetical protein
MGFSRKLKHKGDTSKVRLHQHTAITRGDIAVFPQASQRNIIIANCPKAPEFYLNSHSESGILTCRYANVLLNIIRNFVIIIFSHKGQFDTIICTLLDADRKLRVLNADYETFVINFTVFE